MERIAVGLVVLACVAPAGAQRRPDFSGTWNASKDAPSNLPATPSAVLGPRFRLQQAENRLTLVRPLRETLIDATFPLDGTEVRTPLPGGVCQGDEESIESVVWDADALAFTLVATIPAGAAAPVKAGVTRRLRLQSPDVLIVEAPVRDPVKGETRRVATVYTRSSEPMQSTAPNATPSPIRASLAQVAWISGVWSGTTGTLTVEERWTPATGGSMLATARTLRGGAMTAFEFLCITERQGGLVYTAMPNARTPATDFRLTAITNDSATFENPAHDFPKIIRYTRRADGSLETAVSGHDKQPVETAVLKRVRDQ